MTEERRLRRALVLVGIVTALWVAPGALVRATDNARTTADEPQYLMTALSLAEDRDLDVRDERSEQRYRDFHEIGLPLQEKVRDDGRRVSPHDPLLPAVLAVPMALGGWLAAKLTLAALSGVLAGAMVWVAVRRFAVPLRVAVAAVLACSAAAPLAVYGTQVYPEILAALAVTAAVGATTGPLGRRGLATVSVAIAALPWLSVKYAPVAVAFGVLVLARLWPDGRRRAVYGFVAGAGVAAVVYLAAHVAWYGGPTAYASGSHFTAGELTVMGSSPDYPGRSVRLAGLLLDRDFGLAAWQPALLLAVPALAAMTRRRPPGWAVLTLPLAAGWANATFVALTMHGWWFPGRQVVVVLPCAVLALAWFATRVPVVRPLVVAGGVLGASAFAWLVTQGLLADLRLVVSFDTLGHPLWRAWGAVRPDYRDLGTAGWALHAAWTLALATCAAWGWRSVAGAAPSAEAVPAAVDVRPVVAPASS